MPLAKLNIFFMSMKLQGLNGQSHVQAVYAQQYPQAFNHVGVSCARLYQSSFNLGW